MIILSHIECFIKGLPKILWFNVRASIAGSLCFLTQFISSHEHLFFDVISWIFSLKNDLLILLTIPLNFFNLKLTLTHLEYFFQRFSVINSRTSCSSDSLSHISKVLMLLKSFFSLLTKSISSLLFLIIVYHIFWMNSSLMIMSIVKEA